MSQEDVLKHIGVVVTVGLAILVGAVGYGRLQMKAEKTEVVVEKHEEEIEELEEFSYKQTIAIERVQENDMRQSAILDKLEKRF